EITKELEDLKRKFEELQTNKDLVEGENDKLQSEVFGNRGEIWPVRSKKLSGLIRY
ncbi:hypothetical protein EE612_022102, partial [Oryza sativa]